MGRAADPAAVQRLLESTCSAAPGAYWGRGRARFASADGELEGAFEIRVEPPRRAWAEVRSSALFGLVGERVVVALPGDGHVIVFQERALRLDRVPFEASVVAGAGPWGGVEELQALLAGQVPWPDGIPPEGAEARIGRSSVDVVVPVAPPRGPGEVRLRFEADRLRRFEWWVEGARALEVTFDDHVHLGAAWRPRRVRLHAGPAGLRADLRFEEFELRAGFTDRDFEVGGNQGKEARVQRVG